MQFHIKQKFFPLWRPYGAPDATCCGGESGLPISPKPRSGFIARVVQQATEKEEKSERWMPWL